MAARPLLQPRARHGRARAGSRPRARLARGEPELPGIDWRAEAQVALLEELAAQERLAFPDGPTGDPAAYHTGNEMFSAVDAWALQAMLRRVRPGRLLEVGCGWSSLVTAQVNREVLGRATA